VALPGDHGSWVFLLSPLIIGLFAGGRWTLPSLYLIVAALCGFLVRQPVTVATKALSGRRSRDELAPALFWIAVYAAVGLLHVAGLVIRGYGYILYLAIPGIPVFVWHLVLVSQRRERRQLAVELLATAALALSAPAAMWIGLARPDPMGWLLWLLVWIQSAASILYVHLRLEQRAGGPDLDRQELARRARPALAAITFNLALVAVLSVGEVVPPWLFGPYLLQWLETVRGTLRPAVGVRPTAIGYRQLAVSSLFTVLFVLAWR
jgi:hypothetical protein